MFSRRAVAVERRANVVPPIIALPTGEFLGNDGNWSTFEIRVGTPSQKLRILPSTLIPETWVVFDSACDAGVNTDPNCAPDRGADPGLFDSNASSTWEFVHGYTFAEEGNLGIDQTIAGNYGYDTLGIATSNDNGGVVLSHQVVAAYGATQYWLGYLGLSRRLPEFGNNTQSGFLASLFAQNKIPSLAYSYTAGQFYNSQTNGSLVLGGYDAARFKDTGVSFPVGSDLTRDLVVGVQSIDYADNTGNKTNLMSTGLLSLIDSTLPNIWLPQAACDSFQSAFGLSYDAFHSQYTISDAQRMQNYQKAASVTFTVGANIQGGSTVTINMPYAAFDLNTTSTGNANATHYFPLRVATDSGKYTLGRAFLQEAVLTVDYGRGNFSVNQAIPVSSSTQNVVAILNGTSAASGSGPSTGGSPTGTDNAGASGSKGVNAGAVAGGVVGGVVAIALIAIAAFFFWRRRKVAKAGGSKQIAGSEAGSGNAHMEQINEVAMAKASSPPPVYPGPTDYFGANAKDGINPAGTPGASSSVGSPHHGSGVAQHVATPSSVATPAAATINDLSFQHAYNNGLLAPNHVPANVTAQAGAGAAFMAELQGSDASAMPHELHSPASRSELDTPVTRSELGPGEQRSELWTPVSLSNSASPATHSPHLAAVLEQPGELPGELPADGLSLRPSGSTSVALGSATNSVYSNNNNNVVPSGSNAPMNVTAAELASRPLSQPATFFTENTLTPSPGDHAAGQTGYFSENTSVAGSDAGGLSRGPSIMSATSVAIAGTGRPNVVTHHRSGSSLDAVANPQRQGGFETIGEEQETDTRQEQVSRDGSQGSDVPKALFTR